MENEQSQKKDYFTRKQEQIAKSKAKLQELLHQLEKEPKKETLDKKILRARINRLRIQIEKNMMKFRYKEAEKTLKTDRYNQLVEVSNKIRTEIGELRDQEEALAYQLEYYTRRDRSRARDDKFIDNKMKSVFPKGILDNGIDETVVTAEKEYKDEYQFEIESRIQAVKKEIANLQNEMDQKIEEYKEETRADRKLTKQMIRGESASINKAENTRKREQKENLALTNPTIWDRMKASIAKQIKRFSEWNKSRATRKEEKARIKNERQESKVRRLEQKDAFVTEVAEKTIREELDLKQSKINETIFSQYMENERNGGKLAEFVKSVENNENLTPEEKQGAMQYIDTYRKAEQENIRKIIQLYEQQMGQPDFSDEKLVKEIIAAGYSKEEMKKATKLIVQQRQQEEKVTYKTGKTGIRYEVQIPPLVLKYMGAIQNGTMDMADIIEDMNNRGEYSSEEKRVAREMLASMKVEKEAEKLGESKQPEKVAKKDDEKTLEEI